MKKFILPIIFVALSGCGQIVNSPPMEEKAKVVDVVYLPSQHGSGISPGFSTSGNVTISVTSVDIPQKYAIVFECAHGKFIVEGESQKYKNLWNNLHTGDPVIVTYNEQYLVSRETRKFLKYHFIDARLDR